LRGIDEQVAKAERAVDGHAPVKRNRFIKLTGASKSINRELEAKARRLAGLKGYTTNLTTVGPEFVIDAYHQLWRIEKAFRMSKHDLQARPIYHHKRESIDAHLTIVFAALAVSHWIEHQTGWSIKKFVRTTRRYRTVQIKAGRQVLTAADPLPDDLRDAIAKIDSQSSRIESAFEWLRQITFAASPRVHRSPVRLDLWPVAVAPMTSQRRNRSSSAEGGAGRPALTLTLNADVSSARRQCVRLPDVFGAILPGSAVVVVAKLSTEVARVAVAPPSCHLRYRLRSTQ
jgi:hypothetical protein